MNDTNNNAAAAAGSAFVLVFLLVVLAILIVMIAGMWKVFTKAGKPGWACLIPFYNTYVMLQIAGKPGWWLLFFFIPIANLVVVILMLAGLANNFGKGAGYVIGLFLLPFIFYPMLGFGSAQYQVAEAAVPPKI